MIRRLFSTKYLNQYRYDGPMLDQLSRTYREYKFRELVSTDFLSNAVFAIKNRKARYLSHLKNGHRCFGFENEDGNIVSYFWLTVGEDDRSRPIPTFQQAGWLLADGEAYIWDCRTINACRRQGLYRQGLNRLIYFCQQQNAMKIMMSCDVFNQSSNAGVLSAGFSYYGEVHFIHIGPLKVVCCKKKKPKISYLHSPIITSDVFPGSFAHD